uniref:Uncharacterized protein n=1 Tax=Vitis vinifera TaxID=29760 RepID=A5BPW6_VITVI|nr:hypothetical protein VITISV_008698 [Vitis vinifera]
MRKGNKIKPRQWQQSSYGGNSRPSSYGGRRPRSSCCRRWIPAVADAAADADADTDEAGGDKPRSAADNAAAASSDAALPSPPPDTAWPSTAAAAEEAAAAVAAADSPVADQNRWWIASSPLSEPSLTLLLSLKLQNRIEE